MRIQIRNELLYIAALAVGLVAIIGFLPASFLRMVIGAPFALFFPGYVAVSALFPRKEGPGMLERVGMSAAISLLVAPLVSLIVNYTPWGLSTFSVVLPLTVLMLSLALIAWYRRTGLPEQERYVLELRLPQGVWARGKKFDNALSVLVALSLAAGVAVLGYSMVKPVIGEKFTEFYVLNGQTGGAWDYPQSARVGEQVRVTLGLVNREQQDESYRVEAWINGAKTGETLDAGTVREGGKWEERLGVSAVVSGDKQKVEFFLYRQRDTLPYRSVYFWLDVRS